MLSASSSVNLAKTSLRSSGQTRTQTGIIKHKSPEPLGYSSRDVDPPRQCLLAGKHRGSNSFAILILNFFLFCFGRVKCAKTLARYVVNCDSFPLFSPSFFFYSKGEKGEASLKLDWAKISTLTSLANSRLGVYIYIYISL